MSTLDAACARARAWLDRHQNADGSWGYRPGQPGAGEPTLLAAAAGLRPSLSWLEEAELGWSRLMAPVCLQSHAEAAAFRAQTVDHILDHQGTGGETAGSFDGDLPGWPWVEGTFSWVEPTAWAVHSLRAVGDPTDPRVVERVTGGLAVLADRQCTDGGWNAGTPDILGSELFGYLYLTGLVLSALPRGHSAVRGAQRFLLDVVKRPSPLNLSWAILGGEVHGFGSSEWVERLCAAQDADGGFSGRVDRTALALCALSVAVGGTSVLAPKPRR